MRKPGSVTEFAAERDAALVEAYRQEMIAAKVFNTRAAAQAVVRRPAQRFWVSEERAAVVVSRMMRGESPLARMSHTKKRMYQEIYVRVMSLAALNPRASLADLVRQVVYQPAPEHYLQPSRALQIIYNHRSR
ncbi:MAG: hypothetical protein LUD17_14725 [Bacteroidales bacterium]|nr:hypothetical protein [Bacteroidales bacterium]